MDELAYEKLGLFYLGRPWDAERGGTEEVPLLYDSRDLTTHAVCVGMTGSGKTGLCVTLLEEAALDGVPALVVDPKGDLGNLLLTFPELSPEDFRPWIDEDAARRKGVEPEVYAAQQAELWKKGLASWGQSGERIARLKQAAEFAVYTPRSEAGLPVSILSSFQAPPPALRDDVDLLRERIISTVTSLLDLIGIGGDPLQSREHILLANLLENAWREGRDLDLTDLIHQIGDPPFSQVGVLPLESFYPAKERFALTLALNNLLASPGFEMWLKGTPLDVDRLLYTEAGKPRIAIFSLSHLTDAERMFFVTLLFNQTLGWMRSKEGTSSLRALLYMDEIYGYLPPVANPPSKPPLLTMLKQARAFGLGLLLATQNPVDLDYRALSNIGTWFLGRLQTERDKARVLDGLERAASGQGLSRREVDRILSGLAKRVFLLHNVHQDGPQLFQVRWAMSYLRGPLTRDQLQRLTAGMRAAPASAPAAPGHLPSPVPAADRAAAERPLLAPEIEQRFLPLAGRPGDDVVYQPGVLGAATVHFVDKRRRLEAEERPILWAPLGPEATDADWYEAEELTLEIEDLEDEPAAEGLAYGELPEVAGDPRRYRRWGKDLADALYRQRRLPLFESPTTGLTSRPGESERDFRIRLAEAMREARDEAVDKLRQRYARKLRTLEDRIRRAEHRLEREQSQVGEQKMATAISVGQSLLGALLGGRRRSLAGGVRGISRIAKERQDVKRAREELEVQQRRYAELEAELEADVAELEARFDPTAEALETLELKPRRTDVDVRLVALAWAPYRRRDGRMERAW
ncbi:MAG: DUF87 domain-containing protein [Acidobacteria bacterium]|nr:MAG: DUF87 domain-containing protein [Acidobacteriota bacterium]